MKLISPVLGLMAACVLSACGTSNSASDTTCAEFADLGQFRGVDEEMSGRQFDVLTGVIAEKKIAAGFELRLFVAIKSFCQIEGDVAGRNKDEPISDGIVVIE